MRFFELSVNSRKRGLQVVDSVSEDFESLARGLPSGKEVVNLIRSMGSKTPGKIVQIPAATFAVEPELKTELSKADLSGLVFQEAILSDCSYQVVGFSGVCGPINHRHTSRGDLDSDDFIYVTGFDFDIKSWDKSDCFIPVDTLILVVTDRARDVFESVCGDWLLFTPIEEVEFYSTN